MSDLVRLHVDPRLWLISISSERRTERRRRDPVDRPGAAPRPTPLIRHEPVPHSSQCVKPVDPFTKLFRARWSEAHP